MTDDPETKHSFNQQGQNINGDQINIAGGLTILNAGIRIALVDDFLPDNGDTFAFASFTSVIGRFDTGRGLYGFGDGIQFLELNQLAGGLEVETKPLHGGGDFLE